MTSALTAHTLDASQYGDWNALLAASPQGSVYAMPEYLEALCEAAGGSYRVIAARRGDELAGGVALHERPGGRGLRVSPRPMLYYNGLVLREYPTKYPSQRTSRLLETSAAVERALAAAGYDGITLKNRPSFTDARVFMQQGWSARPGYSYVVPIADLPAAWQRVEQNLRRLVKRCANDGMTCSEDDDFESFFGLHEQTVDRKGTPLYLPGPAFRRFFTRLRAAGLARLYHARLPGGQAVSSQLVLMGAFPVSHSVSAATDAAHLNSGATAFLRWKVFEALSALGYAANDLTDAALNPVAHFKSQLGGNLELCLVLEKAPAAPARWPQRAWHGLRAAFGA
jgi:hypothetical protein